MTVTVCIITDIQQIYYTYNYSIGNYIEDFTNMALIQHFKNKSKYVVNSIKLDGIETKNICLVQPNQYYFDNHIITVYVDTF
jgi:hypothetical protein